ncbi:MAG TPA: macro domain-containing protein [Acidimicrobiia bacterium]|nr:macro domain-containing protein [Acidimicrobiia bacterium]
MIQVIEGDLTSIRADAIVNAANEHLQHGGGVAAAIVNRGGRIIQDESDQWVDEHGPLREGQAAITGAGSLPARFVIHVVGPRYQDGQDNPRLLARAVKAALDAAALSGCRRVALPAISAGIFGYPRPDACQVIVETCRGWLQDRPGIINRIDLVGYDRETADDFRAAL